MKIPVDDIPQSPKEISFSERIEELNEIYAKGSARDFRFPPSLHVALVYYRSGKELFFHGRFEGSIAASCSRCLNDFSFQMDRQFEFVLMPDPAPSARGAEELSRADLGLSFYSRARRRGIEPRGFGLELLFDRRDRSLAVDYGTGHARAADAAALFGRLPRDLRRLRRRPQP